MNLTIEQSQVANSVMELLATNNNGHGFDHIERVLLLGQELAESEEADLNVVILAILLHDADDYKLFGQEQATKLTNSRRILDETGLNTETKQHVLDIVGSMGYNRYLEGIQPTTLEGQIVSDADMLDSIGSQGILRAYIYSVSKGSVFFDPSIPPRAKIINADEYRSTTTSHSVQHFFDKLLLVSSLLLTDAGRREGAIRQGAMVSFLQELFREERATNWTEHLESFLIDLEL